MAKRMKIPFIGWTPQRIAFVFAMVAVVVAVIFRVGTLRRFITGS